MKHPDPRGDDLGDRVKSFESVGTRVKLPEGHPILIRLDGRAFHTLTRHCERPFDAGLRRAMVETARACAEETNATLAYTQSDEINLVLPPIVEGGNQGYFGGRVQKIQSCLAARASVVFNFLLPTHLPHLLPRVKPANLPVFDCRVWAVPGEAEAVEAILWREIDARVNAVSQVGHTHFKGRKLEGVSSQEIKLLLEEKGVDYKSFPLEFRRGVYLQRRRVTRGFTEEERENPFVQRKLAAEPDLQVTRNELGPLDMPPFALVTNAADVIFRGAAPLIPPREAEPVTPQQPEGTPAP